MRRCHYVLILLLLVSLPCARARAGEADPEAFAKAFKRLEGYHDRGLYKDGLRKLAALLEKHERQPYVYGRRLEVEDLTERLVFAKEYGAPGPGDVLSGKVEKWDAQKGYLRVRYTPQTGHDLVESNGVLVFPATIRGPFLVVIEGRRFESAALIAFGGENPKKKEHLQYNAVYGTSGIVERIEGTKRKTVAGPTNTTVKVGRPYACQFKVTETEVSAGMRGRLIGRARKPKGFWGLVGFAADGWTSMTFTGTIEPAWIQTRIDLLAHKWRKAFKQGYKASKYLPAWLFEKPPSAPTAGPRPSREPAADLPVALASGQRAQLSKYDGYLAKARWGSALSVVRRLKKAGAPACVTSYLTARVRLLMGEVSAGLTAIDKSLKTHPRFLGGILLRGEILRHLGRYEDAAAAFKRAVELHPDSSEAYEVGIEELLQADRPDDAHTFARSAASRGVSSETLSHLGRVLVMARNGPKWAKSFDHKSRNYHVFSDIDKNTCYEASKLLEEALTSYRVNFHWVSRNKERRFKVYIFGGEIGFVRYMVDLEGFVGRPHRGIAGLYSPILKQLLIWNLPTKAEMLRTIRHEGFHQYLDRLMPDPPVWFNEGLAEYHENAIKNSQGRLVYGQIHPAHLALLRQTRPAYLSEFLFRSRAKFYGRGVHSYAQSWAFMHMLKKGKSKHRALFKALVEDLQTMHAHDVLKKHFPPDRVQELEPEFRTYLGTLREE